MTANEIPVATEGRPALPLAQALVPVLGLAGLVSWGLIVRPVVLEQPAWPLEAIFIAASGIAVIHQLLLGYDWAGIQASIVRRLAAALPAFLILFSIGLIIASWTVCGTIPMLVDWGLQLTSPGWIYLVAFLATAVFSTLTGTSWGSAGTVGVVLMGMGNALEAQPGILAGAIIGGAYFGDKMSPLSDTTILAAMATDISVYEHIGSMMYTTVPSMILAMTGYTLLGTWYPPAVGTGEMDQLEPFLNSLAGLFHYHPLLLLPPAIVLVGSLRRQPTVPVLMLSVLVACGLALVFQRFTLTDVVQSIHRGFNTSMVSPPVTVPDEVGKLLNRGGLYALNEAIMTAFMVFVYVGALDHVRAMPVVMDAILAWVRSRRLTIVAALAATGLTNAMTSNQYATTFIIGDAFRERFDRMGIPRRVLSRSIEDCGTMLENLVPWTTTAVYMSGTLGVAWSAYAPFQLLSLFNIVIAFFFAATGIACFLPKRERR
jgi:Na+:H+ antiporter, NhaC family